MVNAGYKGRAAGDDVMRVITGSARGRRLKSVKGSTTRPTTDRVKESLFAILGTTVTAGAFLDLYAGTGGVGIEALSRGAPWAVFLDHNRRSTRVIRENLRLTGLENRAEVYTVDVYRGIEILGKRKLKFNVVFLDPPYAEHRAVPTLLALSRAQVVAETGTVVAEHGRGEKIPSRAGSFFLEKSKTYGDTVLSFWRLGAGTFDQEHQDSNHTV